MTRATNGQREEAIANFQYEGRLIDARSYGNGHINDTYLLTFETEKGGQKNTILQRLLADYPADTLHETIKGFHDTKSRFAAFKKAVEKDAAGRAGLVKEEIQFVLDHEDTANYFMDLLEAGELPLRVTHNDTKLNNIMIDNETDKGVCVIDLDTVMPGLAMNDFGDAIRFGASTAAEDERDLSLVSCSKELFVCERVFRKDRAAFSGKDVF